ncbi:MAG: hypothetical protein M3Q64_01460 [bacterium]|nr:hypothetical protein [bacterium]
MSTFTLKPETVVLFTTWKQKWKLIVNGAHTQQFAHTYHLTYIAALDYVSQYVSDLGEKPTGNYYNPVETPYRHGNDPDKYRLVVASGENVYWEI